jgi:hypothetical protein
MPSFRRVKSLRARRKIFDGAGLYLLVTPNGGRYWRYNYRFNGEQKTLSLGVYPDVPDAMRRRGPTGARCGAGHRRRLDCGVDDYLSKPFAFECCSNELSSSRL